MLLVGLVNALDHSDDMLAFATETREGFNVMLLDVHTLETYQLTDGVGSVAYINWSPDGKSLLYTSEPNIIRLDLATDTITNLTEDLQSLRHSSAWSPDGVHIAYLTSSGYFPEITMTDANGTQHQRVGDWHIHGARPPVWSPDGKRIAVIIIGEDSAEVAIINADGTQPRLVTLDDQFNADVIWSPDGTRLAFVTQDNHGYRLEIAELDTGVRRLVMHNATFIGRPAWSPDGKQFAFVKREGRGSNYLYLLADGQIERIINTPVMPSWLSWSPDGTRIALTSTTGNRPTPHLVDVQRRIILPISSYRALYLNPPMWQPRS